METFGPIKNCLQLRKSSTFGNNAVGWVSVSVFIINFNYLWKKEGDLYSLTRFYEELEPEIRSPFTIELIGRQGLLVALNVIKDVLKDRGMGSCSQDTCFHSHKRKNF